MTARVLPNPANLVVSVGANTYRGVVNTPMNAAYADLPSLRAAGWQVLIPTMPGYLVREDGVVLGPMDSGGGLSATSHRADTLQNLTTRAGAPNEIAVASDVDALVRYDAAGQAKPYYRSRLVGKTTIQAGVSAGAGAANAWNAISFVGGFVIEDDLGAASLATSQIVVPVGVDYYEAFIYVPFSEQVGTPNGSTRRARLTAFATAVGGFFSVAPNVVATGVLSETIQGFVPMQGKVSGGTAPLAVETYHDSATVPNLGVGQSLPTLTVLMYRN